MVCVRCGKQSNHQTGNVYNHKTSKHEIADWCSNNCQIMLEQEESHCNKTGCCGIKQY